MNKLTSIIPIPKHLHVFSKYDDGGAFYSECDFIAIDEEGTSCFLETSDDGLFCPEEISNFVQFVIVGEGRRATNWMNEEEFNEYRNKVARCE